jgi:hypothetical protein
LGRRRVQADFDGGTITSDAGGLLLREVDPGGWILRTFAECFDDYRDPDRIEHTVEQLVRQRVCALAPGYEDLNDHDTLRRDPLLATLAGRTDPSGESRKRERDRGSAMAGKSTMNRMENGPVFGDASSRRTKKIVPDTAKMDEFFVDAAMRSTREVPAEVVIDLDPTDVKLHGDQEGRFFHGYYDHYCYLPLFIFWGDRLLCARLRPSNIDGAKGAVDEISRIVAQMRKRWPKTHFMVRGDSGFAREELMTWCENNNVDYLFGLAGNSRLREKIQVEQRQAKEHHESTQKAARVFGDFTYRTRTSWSRKRRVVAKAEHLDKGANPRFVVTSLSSREWAARELYEELYCARGEMENRIKEQQLDLFGDRLSCSRMPANQTRLWLAGAAYVLMSELRRRALCGTDMARATFGTIRLKLFKIGAVVTVSVRQVVFRMSSAYPWRETFRAALANLRAAPT